MQPSKQKVEVRLKASNRNGHTGTFVFEREISLTDQWQEKLRYDLVGLTFKGSVGDTEPEEYKVFSIEDIEIKPLTFFLHPIAKENPPFFIELLSTNEDDAWSRYVFTDRMYHWEFSPSEAVWFTPRDDSDICPTIRREGKFWIIENHQPLIIAHRAKWKLSWVKGDFSYTRSYQFWPIFSRTQTMYRPNRKAFHEAAS